MSTPRIYSYPLPDALIAQILDIGRFLQREFPDDWRNAHNGSEPSGSTFVRRWALACRDANIDVGVNGKRGSEVLSQDVLTLGVKSGAAEDRGGTVPSMVIADVIAGAGGPSPSVGWNDVSAASPGRYIDPWLEPNEQSPIPPPVDPVEPGPPTPPSTTPPSTTPPVIDEGRFRILNEKLDQILAGQQAATDQQAADTAQIGTWMVEQAQGVVSSVVGQLLPAIQQIRCNFRSPFRGTAATDDPTFVEEAGVDPPPTPKTRKSSRSATHKK